MANEVRLIDANALNERFDEREADDIELYGVHIAERFPADEAKEIVDQMPTIDPESLRPKGRWDWKHRHKGGFHKYTGVDAYGETHTITVDERFECDEPYCPKCGKWNESIYLNYCPNCGAKMEG